MLARIGAHWGVWGILMVLSTAVYRLFFIFIDSFNYQYIWYHWVTLVVSLLFMAYSEGYKGFQKAFSPRVSARALYLAENPRPLNLLLAPLFCMGFFGASKKRKIVSYSLSSCIIIFIILIRQLEQPWRGSIDGGVVLGLVWGITSTFLYYIKAFFLGKHNFDPEVG